MVIRNCRISSRPSPSLRKNESRIFRQGNNRMTYQSRFGQCASNGKEAADVKSLDMLMTGAKSEWRQCHVRRKGVGRCQHT